MIISIEKLRKVFNPDSLAPVAALDSLDMEVASPGIIGLLGPNGAGKTTLLRILATIISPTSGRAALLGHDLVKHRDQIRRFIGYSSNTTGLYPRLTPRDTLKYFGLLYDMDSGSISKRIDYLADMLGIGPILDVKNSTLSFGQKQKVSVARIIMHDPELFIMDEPTLGLDVMTGRTVIEFMKSVPERGRTVVFSTHDMNLASKLCEQFFLIHRGRIVDHGRLSDLSIRHGSADIEQIFLRAIGSPPDCGGIRPEPEAGDDPK